MNYIEILRGKKPLMTKSERKVFDAIESGEVDVISDSIVKAAQKCGVSTSLVNKFCYKMGFTGWKELKAMAVSSLSQKLLEGGETFHFLNVQLNSIIRKRKLVEKIVKKIGEDIKNSRRTILFATGFTKIVVDAWCYKWQQIGANISSIPLSLSSTNIEEDEHVIFISCSGREDEKIGYMIERGDIKIEQVSYISLGNRRKEKFKNQLNIGSFNKLPSYERSYPIASDVTMLFLLNYIFFEANFDNPKFMNSYEK